MTFRAIVGTGKDRAVMNQNLVGVRLDAARRMAAHPEITEVVIERASWEVVETLTAEQAQELLAGAPSHE